MSEKSIRVAAAASGDYVATRDAYELDGNGDSRVIPLLDVARGKFRTPIDPAVRGGPIGVTAADTYDLTALPSDLINWLITVGDGSVLTVGVEQSVSGGTLVVTPVVYDNELPPNVVGLLQPKLFKQPYAFRRGASANYYSLPIQSWDVSGAYKIGFHISAISGTSNAARVFAWIEESIVTYADPYYRYVSLLLPMDGANGGVTFWDYSQNNLSPTVGGNVNTSTGDKKYGTASAYFDGSGDYLRYGDSTLWTFGADPFTIEFWAKKYAANGDYRITTQVSGGGASYNGHQSALTSGGMSWRSYLNNAGGGTEVAASFAHDTEWHHYAFCTDGITMRLFRDGALVGSAASPAVGDSAGYFYVGIDWDAATWPFKGYLDDLRITKGIARYTAAFTAPTSAHSTVELAADDPHYWRVPLLLHGTGTNDSVAILDSSWNPKVATVYGNARISTAQSKFGGSSLYFDGNGDYVAFPDSAEFELGALDFTMEAWIRPAGWATSCGGVYQSSIVTKDANGARAFSFAITGTSSAFNKLSFVGFADNTTGYTLIQGDINLSLDTWYHVAVTRYGNVLYLFLDGTLLNAGGTAFSRTIQDVATTVKVGACLFDATYLYYLNGYIDDLRITKGFARYTANFSVPTAAYPSYRER